MTKCWCYFFCSLNKLYFKIYSNSLEVCLQLCPEVWTLKSLRKIVNSNSVCVKYVTINSVHYIKKSQSLEEHIYTMQLSFQNVLIQKLQKTHLISLPKENSGLESLQETGGGIYQLHLSSGWSTYFQLEWFQKQIKWSWWGRWETSEQAKMLPRS